MPDHAILNQGNPVLIQPQPITFDGVQYPRAVFRLWSRAEKLAIGLYEIEREEVPEGMRATGWTYILDGDHVNGVPTLEPIPPAPVSVSVEDLAAVLAPPAQNGDGLVVGRWYPAGTEVEVEGVTYEVIQPFLYANAEWTVGSLAAHLVAQPSAEWAPSTAYAVNDEVTYLGTLYRCLQGHTSQVGWEPPNVPALWVVA